MASIIELAANIVASHASSNPMSGDDLVLSIERVYKTLQNLEGNAPEVGQLAAPEKRTLSVRQAFKKDEVLCMVCGQGGFKTLTRHLRQAHDLKPGQYRKQFGIPASQSLTAKAYSEARREAANRNNLAANLEKSRAVRAGKKAGDTKTKAAKKPAVTAAAKGKVKKK